MTASPARAASAALLQIRGLTVTYSGDRPQPAALRDANLYVLPGEIVGILGESGAGKSTLALAALGLLPESAHVDGSIRLVDHIDENLLQARESRWRQIRGSQISMIFQDPGLSLNPVMRIGDQITEVLRAHRKVNRDQYGAECAAILRAVQLDDVERIFQAYPHQLSGGQLHRIVIAQALICKPRLLIADEPTRSLDSEAQATVLDVLKETHRKFGTSLLFITHNPALLAGFANRVVVMYAGRVVEDGPTAEVLRQPLHPYTRGLLELIPNRRRAGGERRLNAIPGALTAADQARPGCIFAPRCFAKISRCDSEFPDSVFPRPDHRVDCFNHGK